MKKFIAFLFICFVFSKTVLCQTLNNSLYVFGSPNLQFVSTTYVAPGYDIKSLPWGGSYIGFGYNYLLKKNYIIDICFGYNMKNYRDRFDDLSTGKIFNGKIESNINLFYINQLNESKTLAVHLGYGIDFFGVPDTIKWEYPSKSVKEYSFGYDRNNMYFEIGFGLFHHKFLKTFYTGISFKKGFFKGHEQLFINTSTNQIVGHTVTFQDNISINLKYYFRKNHKNISTLSKQI